MTEQSPQGRTPEPPAPAEVTAASSRLVTTRWVAGALVPLLSFACSRLLHLPLPERALYLVGAVILIYNALLAWRTPRPDTLPVDIYLGRIRRFVILQVALDWISMAAFLHLTGGITSPAISILLIHMLMVTILLPGASPYVYVALGTGGLGVIAILERVGALPHYTVIPTLPEALHRDPIFIAAQVAFFAIAAFATVHLAALVMSRLRERERQVAALLQATQAVSSTLSLPDVLQRLARSAASALSMSRASIRLLDETGERLPMVANCGLSDAYRDKGQVYISRSPLDREAMSGQPVIVHHAPTDARIQYPRQVSEEGIGSIIVVPIIGRAGPMGVLRVYAEQPDRFTSRDVDYVMAIARQGAVAIENAMAHDALQKADRARGQFVRTVTHEVRAPVSGAQSLLRVLLRGMAGDVSKSQRDILARVSSRLDLLMELINDLLALGASKTAELQEPPQPVDLQPTLQREVDLLAQEAREKQIRLTFEAPDETLTVEATADGLSQVFRNLIGNAVKYTPPGGRVDVRLKQQDQSAAISVSDTGIGIPAEDLSHLWEEFFRATNARRSEIVGTGLGLSIVKRLVETYNGLISVQSAEGKGTTFTVTLPLLRPKPGT